MLRKQLQQVGRAELLQLGWRHAEKGKLPGWVGLQAISNVLTCSSNHRSGGGSCCCTCGCEHCSNRGILGVAILGDGACKGSCKGGDAGGLLGDERGGSGRLGWVLCLAWVGGGRFAFGAWGGDVGEPLHLAALALDLVEKLLGVGADLHRCFGANMFCLIGWWWNVVWWNVAITVAMPPPPSTLYPPPLAPKQPQTIKKAIVFVFCPSLALLGDGVWLANLRAMVTTS